ncbi:hypothetical protein GH733_006433 [Mirounga leonina]|nr:hypothetical protein GH733_006433 [Mirounga leonina]
MLALRTVTGSSRCVSVKMAGVAPTRGQLCTAFSPGPCATLLLCSLAWIILVSCSKSYGNVLVLAGVIQCAERDEFSYREMTANLPLCSHPNPCKVLVIGAGDEGVLQEVCEIDKDVVQVSEKFLPGMAVGGCSPKLTLHVGDGFEFTKQNQDAFDVIITDSSDPVDSAKTLFKESYYQLVKVALKNEECRLPGRVSVAAPGPHQEMRQFCKLLFPLATSAYCTISTYPSDLMGFMLCSKNPSTNFQKLVQQLTLKQVEKMQLNCYNSDVHQQAPSCLSALPRP